MDNIVKYSQMGKGTPVVLIHGFPLDRRMWQPQREVLAAAGFRVICPDLPGFGESPLPAETLSMGDYADAVITLLDQLGIEKAIVGGMSMGGYVLLDLAYRYGNRLTGALFIVTRAAADDAAARNRRTQLTEAVKQGNRLIVPDTFAKILFAPEVPQNQPELVNTVRQMMASTSPAGLIAGLLAMRDREDFVARLPLLHMPSLVIGAAQDQAVPPEHAEILAQGLFEAELKIIPGAGHMVNMEDPLIFNQAVLEFLLRFRKD